VSQSLLHSLFESCVEFAGGGDLAQVLKDVPHCRGVLLFADESYRSILFLTAADVKRLALNRLTLGDETIATKRVKLSRITRFIFYRCTWCDFASAFEHYKVARAIYPDRWREFVRLPAVPYVRIDMNSKWPAFTATDNLASAARGSTHIFGPFPTRKSAQDFISILEEAFALCRKQCLIDCPSRARTCPYYQMHTCRAVCLGGISREEYFAQLEAAVDAARGKIAGQTARIESQMKDFARGMKFEEAAEGKKRLEALKQLGKKDFTWVTEISDLAIVHLDEGPFVKPEGQKKKVRQYIAFRILSGRIIPLTPITADQFPALKAEIERVCHSERNESVIPAPDFSRAGSAGIQSSSPDHGTAICPVDKSSIINHQSEISDHLSLLCAALYRSKPSGLWLKASDLLALDSLPEF
jgi:hypothetical protein